MNKYRFKLLTSTGLGHEYFYCYGDEYFEQWLKRKNIKYEIDKKSINRFNKQKEVLDKIKEYINKHCVNQKVSKEVGYKCFTMADTQELEHIYKLLEEIE